MENTALACIRCVRDHIPACDISAENSFELGTMLELQPHLLELVFKYLDCPDLRSAALVNATWDRLAEYELLKRISPAWISCTQPRSTKQCRVETSSGFRYNNVAISVIAYCPKTIKLDEYICFHDENQVERMTYYIAKDVVPDKTQYCTISCTEVAPSNIGYLNTKLFYQGIFIPYIPNIRTAMYYYNPRKNNHLLISDREQVKCLLLFTVRHRKALLESLFMSILQGRSLKDLAMGGGLIKGTKTFLQNNGTQRLIRADDVLCIAFLQKEDVDAAFNAYSTVIICDEKEENNYEPFETELIKFKKASILRKHGIIFRFCCYAKTVKDGETAIIQKHFPRYSLLGLEVDGEFGWNSWDAQKESGDCEAESPRKSKRAKSSLPTILHGWSTILVLVTWGKKS